MTARATDGAQRIAITAAHDLVAGALLRLLAERSFPVASVLALSDAAGQDVQAPDWEGSPLELESTETADLSGIDLLFLCGPCEEAAAVLERAVDSGARVIDLIGIDRLDGETVLSAPDLAPGDSDDSALAYARVLRSPDPLALVLAMAVLPLIREGGLSSLRVQWLLPASILGEPGVRELAGQAENLFNQRELPQALYGHQIAFNLLAGSAGPASDPLPAAARDLALLLGEHDAPGDQRAVWVPVFFGCAATIWVETSELIAPERVLELLRSAPGVLLSDPSADDGPFPTPVEHALDSDAVHLAVLGRDGASGRGHVLWMVADDVRRGRALNAVRIAEELLAVAVRH